MSSASPAVPDITPRVEQLVRDAGVLMVTELIAQLNQSADVAPATDTALIALEQAGRLVVAQPTAADPHFASFDLRAVAVVHEPSPAGRVDATERARRHADACTRDAIQGHRCGAFGCAPRGAAA